MRETFRRSGVLAAAFAGLAGLAAAEEPKMPPVYLNHVYLVLDAETFRAADASEYLRTAFAPFERRTTKSGDDTWTGPLLLRREHVLRVSRRPIPKRDRPVGQSGVAFGVEETGSSVAVRKALDAAKLGDAKTVERTRETAGKMVPWFKMTGYEPIDPVLVFWVMEYAPSFLKEWHPELRPGLSGIARKPVLERYQAKAALTVPPKDPLFRNVTAFRLALDSARAESFGKALAALGYRREAKGAERFLARSGRAHRRRSGGGRKAQGSSRSRWP